MTHQEIKELAGHRAVSPWIMKLVNDAVAKERESCAKICEEFSKIPANMSQAWRNGCLESATEIRERNKNEN